MVSYQLSKAAAEDLDHLYTDGIIRYGLEQANHYYEGLINQFRLICDNPRIGFNSDEIVPNLQKFQYRRHVIFFMNTDTGILIVRMLGEEMDFSQHL